MSFLGDQSPIALRYINALEERIAFLEARLPEYGQDHLHAMAMASARPGHLEMEVPATQADHSMTTPSDDSPSDENPSLVDGVAFLSLFASGTPHGPSGPVYLGSSSGAAIARMIESSIFRAAGSQSTSNDTLLGSLRAGFKNPSTSASEPDISFKSAVVTDLPPKSQAQTLFTVFFDRLHTRFPMLDRKSYRQAIERQYEQGVLSVVEKSTLHLIYAISARFMQLTKMPCDINSEV
jgi:hypothetical protein